MNHKILSIVLFVALIAVSTFYMLSQLNIKETNKQRQMRDITLQTTSYNEGKFVARTAALNYFGDYILNNYGDTATIRIDIVKVYNPNEERRRKEEQNG